jgi:pyruvate/2-oxoglutarate dehydrogenase complex dihydrolipoamide acyltransferase (E2) component
MSRELRFQDPGEGIHEAEIVEVNVSEGDRIAEDDTVLAVETDKATTEIPSPYSGKVESVAVEVGDQVRVGDLVMSFAAQGLTKLVLEPATGRILGHGHCEPRRGRSGGGGHARRRDGRFGRGPGTGHPSPPDAVRNARRGR